VPRPEEDILRFDCNDIFYMRKTNPIPIFEVLSRLEAPFGPSCPSIYKNLSECWGVDECIDWDVMHPSLDPLSLLDNPQLSGQKKHQMDVYEQTVLISSAIVKLPSPAEGNQEGKKATRGLMKRWQVESFHRVLRCLLQCCPSGSRQMRVVDFGCGSGSLLLPLASLFPQHIFIGVDMKVTSLAILKQRGDSVGLTNVETFVGKIEEYSQPFDVALALHACGNASDMAILKAMRWQAAFILTPCCIGKLKFSILGGSSFSTDGSLSYETPKMKEGDEQKRVGDALLLAAGVSPSYQGGRERNGELSTGSPLQPEIILRHPRSKALREALGEQEAEAEFRRIARVADTNAEVNSEIPLSISEEQWIERLHSALEGNSTFSDKCQVAKVHIELDRLLAAAEEGYRVGLYRLINSMSHSKGDLLVGVPSGSEVEGRGLS
jgi:SAM-dependent methyltransferase